MPIIAKYANIASVEASTLVGATEATEMLGVSKDTLIRMIARGVIKAAHKLPGPNGAYLFERAEIERAAAGKAGAAS